MYLHHEGSMVGVQCQLMICRGHIRASKGTFQIFFVVYGSMANWHLSRMGGCVGGWMGQWSMGGVRSDH